MLRFILNLNAFCVAVGSRGIGPHFPATKGEVWPKPQHQVKKNTVFSFDRDQFQIKVVGVTCPFLSNIVARYSHLYARQSQLAHRIPDHSHQRSRMGELHVDLTGSCENYPHLGMHENYNLTIAKVSTLRSGSIWGILRGLQTVLHSFNLTDDYREILINATDIVDSPRFSHRGLLLDTSRHYVSLQNILLILDAMEMNKMNVFHWHIVDDESFPYQSHKFPELSEHAAYYPTMVYTTADIVLVLKYARERGIRVIPEFDVPGHTLSWGVSHPEILTKCVDGGGNMRGVLNPVKNATFELLGALVKEVQDLFPDASFHVGGDEVFSYCWDMDPTIQAYLKEHNMNTTELLPMFMNKLFAILGARSQPIVWQEVFENMYLPANIPVQIWKSDPFEADSGKKKLNQVLEAGNMAILSAPWYLDLLNNGCWDYYQTDPLAMVVNKALVHNVLGGEACMWGESIDDRNVISSHECCGDRQQQKIWPRASTIAEVLWSSPPFDASYHNANKNRLEEHTCRMLRYDINAQPPNGRPGFCVLKPYHFGAPAKTLPFPADQLNQEESVESRHSRRLPDIAPQLTASRRSGRLVGNMLRYIFILNAISAFCAAGGSRGIGPDFPATKGEVWPKPQHQVKKNTVFSFDPAQFQIKVVGVTCPFLSSIVARYSHLYARQSRLAHRIPDHSHQRSRMGELHVDLTGSCENYPHFGMHENYNLTIAKVSTLRSGSIWGILRGLQTVLHSFYLTDDYREILINATDIVDSPRFSHRGLLLDTSRHYVSLQNILLILDAMEMNKMNVFHWHIVDDESFPYQSHKFPELSEHAAYYPTMVYTTADIVLVLKYARERGIRVIPEFDVPGHTLSWGVSHPEILTKCVDGGGNMRGVLNPVKNATFELLGALVKEVQDLFPDASFHVGGDEVFSTCWDLDPTVQAYVKEHNMNTTELLPMFMNKLFALLGARSQPIVWQEVFENMSLPANIPVQIWKSDPIEGNEQYADNGKKNLNKVLEAGNKAILSAPWYLDHLNNGCWDYYNQTDPLAMVVNKDLVKNVLGGDACMWGESIDDRNVISRIWPRASTIAEVLWSSPPFDASYHNANKNRLEEHTCRMLRYDIGAQPPNGRPGFCVLKPNHF